MKIELPAQRAAECGDVCVLASPPTSAARQQRELYSRDVLEPCQVLCRQYRWDVLVAAHGASPG